MVAQAIRYLLIGDGNEGNNPQYEIYDFVGDNVFPNVLAQNYGLPAIVYTIRNVETSKIKSFRALANTIDVEIDIIAETYAQVSQISTLVANNLHRYSNIYNSNSSSGIGYGTEKTSGYNGYGPASTGPIQYVGGLQILDLYFTDSTESYDDILENYRNTLSFKMTYVNDATIWGADVMIKLNDLNLMATTSASGNLLFKQPIAIDDGVNYLWCPSIYSNSDNINYISEALSVNTQYPLFYDTSLTSNSNRPILRESALNPPKFNKLNYLEFAQNKYLVGTPSSLSFNRDYKEMTFFAVITLPNSYASEKGASILFKRSTASTSSGGVGVKSQIIGSSVFFSFFLTAREDDGAGGENEKSSELITLESSASLNPDLRFSEPVFFAFSVSRETTTKLSGETDIITASYINKNWSGDGQRFNVFEIVSSTTWSEYFFNFGSLHSDRTSYNTNGAGTINLNDELHLYDLVIYPEKLTFGSAKYNEIKNSILEKHKMVNTFKSN